VFHVPNHRSADRFVVVGHLFAVSRSEIRVVEYERAVERMKLVLNFTYV
jgi:uncharacterized integral membrane protein